MSQEVLLKINNIDVFHGTFQALWNVSLEVRRGEMLALIGANTSGKTTLMDTISGLLHPAKGSIEFEGKDITQIGSLTRSLNLALHRFRKEDAFSLICPCWTTLIIGSYSGRARVKKRTKSQEGL